MFMKEAIVACVALLFAATFSAVPCDAQNDPANDDEARIADIVTASHVLANEGILDSFGHISARSAKNPEDFFMPRAMALALVTRDDIVEVGLDCKPISANAPRLNGERYIHCQIYKARSDVQSVIYTHDLAVIPFGVAGVALKPVVASRFLAAGNTTVRDSRCKHVRKAARHVGPYFAVGRRARQDAWCGSSRLDARSRGCSCGTFGTRGHRSDHLHPHRRAGAKCRIDTQFEDHALERIGTGIQFNGKFRRG